MGLLGLAELSTESREELFAAWRAFFERLADQAPVLLVFWDLQWADQGLLDFIEHLLTWARSSPIFVLAEARRELFELREGSASSHRSDFRTVGCMGHASQIALGIGVARRFGGRFLRRFKSLSIFLDRLGGLAGQQINLTQT